jgi:hypothetical protein
MGDAIAVLPTDKIPSTSTEKEAIILLYGDTPLTVTSSDVDKSQGQTGINPNSFSTSVSNCISNQKNNEYSTARESTRPNGVNSNPEKINYRGEITTILFLVVMFAIWTLPPFTSYVQECIPVFKKLWVLYWFLQILFFGVYAFFIMNIDHVKTK